MVDQKEQHYYHISSIDKVQENRATMGWDIPKKYILGLILKKIFLIFVPKMHFSANLHYIWCKFRIIIPNKCMHL